MTNYKFFKRILNGQKKYFSVPKLEILDERNKFLKDCPDSWGYFSPDEAKIYLLKQHDNVALRIHEYGHWINSCIYNSLDIAWEFLWWGLSLRSLFKNRQAGE